MGVAVFEDTAIQAHTWDSLSQSLLLVDSHSQVCRLQNRVYLWSGMFQHKVCILRSKSGLILVQDTLRIRVKGEWSDKRATLLCTVHCNTGLVTKLPIEYWLLHRTTVHARLQVACTYQALQGIHPERYTCPCAPLYHSHSYSQVHRYLGMVGLDLHTSHHNPYI